MPRRVLWYRNAILVICAIAGSAPTSADEFRAASPVEPDTATRIEHGLNYLYGNEVDRDHVRALERFILADNEKYYHLVANHLTQLQISHAAALADIFAGNFALWIVINSGSGLGGQLMFAFFQDDNRVPKAACVSGSQLSLMPRAKLYPI